MLSGILWICLFQSNQMRFQSNQMRLQGDQVRQMDAFTMTIAAQSRAIEDRKNSMAAQERKLFEAKFNKLLDAIHRFSEEYNNAKGAVWPSKQAELVQKAFRDLEHISSWPKSQPTQGVTAVAGN